MNIYSSSLVMEAASAAIVEQINTGDNYVMFMFFPEDNSTTHGMIKRVTYTLLGDTETYTIEYPDGKKQFTNAWADRATLTYNLYK